MNPDSTATRVLIDGIPHWQLDGRIFPVISGGDASAEDPPDEDQDADEATESRGDAADDGEPADGDDAAAYWKKRSREWERRAKENKAARDHLDKIEQASKTEAQKLAERAEQAERDAATARAELLRERVGRRHNLPDDLVTRLVGDDEDALEEDAKRLAELLNSSTAPAPGPQRPKERVDSTAVANDVGTLDPDELAAKVRRDS